jgi:hypothetical protein
MTTIFEETDDIVDVDNFMTSEHEYWRFDVDIEKATRFGVSVDSINQHLDMAMGGYKLGDIKQGVVREPTFIVIQVPMAIRSQLSRLYSIPVMPPGGSTIPLGELGRFVRAIEDPLIFHKDLRPVEFVTAELEGKLGAPLYGISNVEEKLEDYLTPDGVHMSALTLGGTIARYGAPEDDVKSGFEWTGEWTVTYETFRDMGAAFMAALLLIYGLIVWEFKNFTLAGLIMAPIPLTLIGIIPGHLIIGAEFTATSMIGFIALAGIIVRNSILLVEFVKHEVEAGKEIVEAVISAGQIRMRPILITAGTLMVGAAMLFSDPIFVGMAASLFFGTLVATVLTLVVIPLGCITVSGTFYEMAGVEIPEKNSLEENGGNSDAGSPAWLIVWTAVLSALTWLFRVLNFLYLAVQSAVVSLLNRFKVADIPQESPDEKQDPVQEKAEPPAKESIPDKSEEITSKVVSKKKPGKKEPGKKKASKKKIGKKKTATKTVKKAGGKVTKKKASKKSTGKKRRGISLKKIDR